MLGNPCYPRSWTLNCSGILSMESWPVLNFAFSCCICRVMVDPSQAVSSSQSFVLFYFVAQYLILRENAILQAKGSSYFQDNNGSSGGGGGGGIIVLSFTEGFVGMKPLANQSTKGGDGNFPGDNGLIIINGRLTGGHSVLILSEDIKAVELWNPKSIFNL